MKSLPISLINKIPPLYEVPNFSFNLVNEIICNLIQYKGIRRPLATPSRRNLYKKETFLWDYKKNVGYVNGQ